MIEIQGEIGTASKRGDQQSFDPKQITAALSKLVSASVGDIALIMSRAPSHKFYALADIEWMVLPPVLAGQFYVAEAMHTDSGARAPIACVTWAKVSDDVDRRLTTDNEQPIRLRPDEWTSGKNLWLIDVIGDQLALKSAINSLTAATGPFHNQTVKLISKTPNGEARVDTLADVLKASRESVRQ